MTDADWAIVFLMCVLGFLMFWVIPEWTKKKYYVLERTLPQQQYEYNPSIDQEHINDYYRDNFPKKQYIGVTTSGYLDWGDDRNTALHLARRQDADALATIVEDCWQIGEYTV